MNHFLLDLVARHLGPELRGYRVGGVRWLPPVLSIGFMGEGKTRCGVVILSAPGPFFFADTVDPIAGLGEEVLRRIQGLAVSRVEVPGCDRAIRFSLSAPREDLALTISLHGSAAKVRVEGRQTVIESIDPRENGGPLPSGPAGGGPTLAEADSADFARYTASSDVPERAIAGLTRELLDCFALGAGSVDVSRLLLFRDGLVRGDTTFVLGTRRRVGAVSPLPPTPSEGTEPMAVAFGPYARVDEACREAGGAMVSSLQDTIVDRCAAPLVKHLSARRRLLAVLEGERREAENSGRVRREANILAAYRSRVGPGAREVTLPDLYGSGELTISLDPSIPLREQIDKRFRLAAKLERKQAALVKRVSAVEEEVAGLERELAGARSSKDLREAVTRIDRAKKQRGLSTTRRRSGKMQPKSRERRRFDLHPQWFVLVGRSDRENDEITFRIADPDDVWLHAQHVAGSHVVLKSRGPQANPPEAVLEAAAEIAAHYSKARRASVVPVIYTRRKYVRKFKGAKPGQVTCEREKTILARPRLPESSDE